jgi:tRNA (cytidine/uridine-2'-O-)-methyltransferase
VISTTGQHSDPTFDKAESNRENLNIVLVEPEIPPNTGNIARLCAAIDARLHLVGDLGFKLTDRYLKRAGLDYWQFVKIIRHESVDGFFESVPRDRLFLFSKKGSQSYVEAEYRAADYLVFGSETRGLPARILNKYPERIVVIPILCKHVRSLNLSSAAAVAAYEALRQMGFKRSRLD